MPTFAPPRLDELVEDDVFTPPPLNSLVEEDTFTPPPLSSLVEEVNPPDFEKAAAGLNAAMGAFSAVSGSVFNPLAASASEMGGEQIRREAFTRDVETPTLAKFQPLVINPDAGKSAFNRGTETSTTFGGPPKRLADVNTLRASMPDVIEAAQTPPIPFAKFEAGENDSIPLAVGKEAANILISIPEFFTTPIGAAVAAVGAVAPGATAAVFTVDLLLSLGEQIYNSYKDWGEMTPNQKAIAVTDMVGTGAMAGMAGKHATTRVLDRVMPARRVADMLNKSKFTPEPKPINGLVQQVGFAGETPAGGEFITPTPAPLRQTAADLMAAEAEATKAQQRPGEPLPAEEPAAPAETVVATAAELAKKPAADIEAKKEAEIKARIPGLTDTSVRVVVQPDVVDPKTGKLIVKGYVQLDEVHPVLGNVFSSNPEQLNRLGFSVPTREQFLKLPMGRYTLKQAREMIQTPKPAAKRLTIEEAEKPARPTKPAAGNVRLYHAEGETGGSGYGGSHFAKDQQYAANFGPKQSFVDVPQAVYDALVKEAESRGHPRDLLLPNEWVKKSKPVDKPLEIKTFDLDAAPEPAAAPVAPAPRAEGEQARTSVKDGAFERAQAGDEKAFDDLDAQFREIYPDDIDFGRPGRFDPNTVHTPQAFAALFNKAFKDRDFDAIITALKATSDVSIWKPFFQEQFRNQKTDPVAYQKGEWIRHIFNGTRPPEAKAPVPPRPSTPHRPPPPVTPPPRRKPGQPPPPRPPPTPPGPVPVRIPVEPATGVPKSPYKILEDFSAAIGKALRVLRMKKNTLGVYRPGSTTTAERFAGDLDTAAHELAGHWTDDRYGIGKPWVAPKTRSPYDSELAKFWIFGSVKPTSTLRYRRAEGIAEFIRAYVVNPVKAKAEAPNFSAYFERTLPPQALKAINDFGLDVRTWAGADPLVRAGLNIRMEPPTLTERLWKGLTGRGFGFEINPIDRLRLMFDDPYHFAVKANKAIRELRGGAPQLPAEQFELTARLLATHDARMSDQFERGLVPLRPGQKPNAKGELEVERIVDPVTQRPTTMKWLLDWADTSSKAKMDADLRAVSGYMVDQRTLEKAAQLGRDENVSGVGAGILTDVQAARQTMARVNADPALKAKLEEGARRYRLWADQNINMLVDAGRITRGQAFKIRKDNQHYVDMHRLSSEFDVASFAQSGRHIGTPRDVIKRFKGSSLEINNVFSNLLEQMDSIQKEAHRNVVMNNFTDGLRNLRQLHGPELRDFDQFGRKVTSADKNTITVYKNGKAEHWQFAPEIHQSLKGLGELGTNWLFSAMMLPSRLARYMITRGPSFMIRNPLRDTFERSVNSRSSGKPWDIFQGYTQAELSRYEVFGGGQFGNYIVDAHVWNREIKQVMRELVKDPKNILLSPLKLKNAWEALGEKSEKLGRIAEFRRAFEIGKKQIAAANPKLTPKEVEYNAALYAAGQARGLLDFAKAGTVMKYINQAVPFSNAAVRGLAKSVQGMKENPAGYAMRWGVHVLLPTLAVMMWNRRDEKTWKEYLQLPSYRRDFFWNLKVGDHWLTIPKPHLLGVLAGGVERIITSMMGEPHAMGGVGKSLQNVMPVNTVAEASGPLKTFLELNLNRDTFRNRDIIPSWEKDLDVGLRKGAKFSSGTGQGIAKTINLTGLGIDPRQVDFVLKSLGGWGNIATSATTKNRSLAETAVQSTGLLVEPPGTNAEDVNWVLDWARKHGKISTTEIKELQRLRTEAFDAKTSAAKERTRNAVRREGTRLRKVLEHQK